MKAPVSETVKEITKIKAKSGKAKNVLLNGRTQSKLLHKKSEYPDVNN